ncbi:alpha-N-methyltransferase NTM1 [Podospora fimiseda]|uniref:Alpha N-terminal protein methyltransferase 1 n=1 Tax=Podospora fimiseda TaxID=252190 RepID=A0AAN7BIZ1_9PEZI|nr:alpha-N-methyltransferase NTM1 [Podospora fimiseda]
MSKPDSLISKTDGLAYWTSISPDITGMLGGFPHISRVDLRGSRNFLAKHGFGSKPGSQQRVAKLALEGGAGIGRITQGLLLDGICEKVDVIEPVEKFTAKLKETEGVRKVWNIGLEDWVATEGEKYDLIWIQWCVGHLRDEQLVAFLKRCKGALVEEGDGLIVVKENNTTGMRDEFDEVDSSVTRADASLRRIFKEAGLKLLRAELQSGFQAEGLLPVRMYALKPE